MQPEILRSIDMSSELAVKWLLLPAALLAVFTIIILFLMALKRQRAARDGSVDPKYFRLYQGDGLTDELQLWNRHFNNLLEMPILYYFAVIVAVLTQQITIITVVISWLYLLFRLLHSWVHLKGNRVINRFKIFGLSVFILLLFWVVLIVGLFL